MTIEVGEKIPDVELKVMGPEGPQVVSTGALLGTGKVVLFAVPGAFTPGCSRIHLPGYVEGADALLAKGVDKIVCVAVNDAWVMDAWGRSAGADEKITMLADGSGVFTKAVGLESDMTPNGLGVRSQRYSMVIEDGIVTHLDIEPKPGVDVSSCEAMLGRV
jgi:peroxiredoxin